MHLAKIDAAAEDICTHAAVGPSDNPAEGVHQNRLSPHFKHYTHERIRSVMHEAAQDTMTALDLLFNELHVKLLEEDNKLGNAIEPNTPNGDAVRAVAADCANTRLQLLGSLQTRMRAIVRQTTIV